MGDLVTRRLMHRAVGGGVATGYYVFHFHPPWVYGPARHNVERGPADQGCLLVGRTVPASVFSRTQAPNLRDWAPKTQNRIFSQNTYSDGNPTARGGPF